MDELTTRNFLALNETIKKQRAEISALYARLSNAEKQVANLQQQINALKSQVDPMTAVRYGTGPTTR